MIFEKDPIAAHAIHMGLSHEAATEHYTAMMARRNRTFEVCGKQYRAAGRCDALAQHEDATGVWAGLDSVVEVL